MFQNLETGIFCCTIEYKRVNVEKNDSIHFYIFIKKDKVLIKSDHELSSVVQLSIIKL